MSKFSAYQILKRRKTFIAYFFAAASGVVVQYVVGTIICIRYLGLPFNAGVSWGYLAAIPVGFFLSKNMAFDAKESGNTKIEILKYLVTLVFSYIITVQGAALSLWSLTQLFGEVTMRIPFTSEEFSPIGTCSHFAGMGFSFIFNYLAHKKFTFA